MQTTLTDDPWLSLVGSTAILAVVAWLAAVVARRGFLALVRRAAGRTRSTWDDHLVEHGFFRRLAALAPALVVFYGVGFALGVSPAQVGTGLGPAWVEVTFLVVRRVAAAYMVVTLALAFGAFLAAMDDIYRESYGDEANNRPIKGYLQVLAIFVYVATGIVVVAVLADRSPLVFLSGLGALTAVLLLVFKDTILSLVASVQIMSNDMIRIGDWVEMPQAHADGDVVDIALHTVKIQNWDKTITTVPTHRFISDSFRNWRGMSESGGRRIKRSLDLDLGSVRFLTPDEVARFSRWELLGGYMERKRDELAAANPPEDGEGGEVIPERRRLTNLGTFRAYAREYLARHPGIHDGMTILVRALEPGPEGVPVEIYCFTSTTAWADYERIQGDVFDHLLALLPEFGLRAYQKPAGSDLERAVGAAGAVEA